MHLGYSHRSDSDHTINTRKGTELSVRSGDTCLNESSDIQGKTVPVRRRKLSEKMAQMHRFSRFWPAPNSGSTAVASRGKQDKNWSATNVCAQTALRAWLHWLLPLRYAALGFENTELRPLNGRSGFLRKEKPFHKKTSLRGKKRISTLANKVPCWKPGAVASQMPTACAQLA
jgi:hypothetical protein